MKNSQSIIVIVCLVLILLSPASVYAQDKLEILTSSSSIKFPSEITFSISAQSPVTINDIRLRYFIDQLGFVQVINEAFLEFSVAPSVKTDWTLDMRRLGDIAPGTKIKYWWLVSDTQGNRIETDPVEIIFDDQRFHWQSLTEGQVTVYWYEGSNTFAKEIMNTAQQSITRLSGETGISLVKPIRFYIYANSNDLRGAFVFPRGWEGGVSYRDYPVVAGAVSPSQLTWGKSLISHELSHVVTHQLTLNPYSYIPIWLNEGISMHAEGLLDSYHSTLLRKAIEGDKLISVMSLTSQFSADSDLASLSYAESYSIVDFLIKNYGQNKILELLNVFKQGSTYDEALKTVFGFDMEGLNAQWLNWVSKQ